eukprot:TRINITY_DN784_c1_g1_i1.p1 TRINITY_DN784_c1_g1~~TRINITY_DN784_c1_g1_i1.p1  ORF type:complete len:759 (-),score=164.75 TRINITY_DN784_c1_g1_i1:78-2078(-)
MMQMMMQQRMQQSPQGSSAHSHSGQCSTSGCGPGPGPGPGPRSKPDLYASYLSQLNAMSMQMQMLAARNPPIYQSEDAQLLFDGIKGKDIGKCRDALLNHNQDVNSFDSAGYTALHYASKAVGNTEMVKFLLHHSANPNIEARTANKETPLLMAVTSSCDVEVVNSLLEGGANPRHCTSQGQTPLHLAVASQKLLICILLLQKDAHLALVSTGGNTQLTPLHIAASVGNHTLTKIMLAFVRWAVSDVTTRHALALKDGNGMTPLHHAAQKGHLRVVGVLCDPDFGGDNSPEIEERKERADSYDIESHASLPPVSSRVGQLGTRNNHGLTPVELAQETAKTVSGHQGLAASKVVDYLELDAPGVSLLQIEALKRTYQMQKIFGAPLAFFGVMFLLSRVFSLLTTAILAAAAGIFCMTKYSQLFSKSKDSMSMGSICCLLYVSGAIFSSKLYWVSAESPMTCLGFAVSLASSLYLYHSISTKDAGVASFPLAQVMECLEAAKENKKRLHCRVCLTRKTERTHHCKDCNRCVSNCDQHLSAAGNCMSTKTLTRYMGFLASAATCFALLFVLCRGYFDTVTAAGVDETTHLLKRAYIYGNTAPFISLAMIFLVSYSVYMAFTVLLILCQISFGLTTRELFQKGNHLITDGRFSNPYNRGILANWAEFLRN